MPDPNEPPWAEVNRPWWVPAGCAWLAPTRRWKRPEPAGPPWIVYLMADQTRPEFPAVNARVASVVRVPAAPPRHGPESEGDPRDPVWGAGCGVDDY